ncbi:MAG: PTS sugar transporter subunit IIA [Chitinispirillaceae bacterium]|nr:PTS sugar transporter subunit IIA [Chitinispirillaceae bacterium]
MKLSSALDRRLVFLDHRFDSYPEIVDFIAEKLVPFTRTDAAVLREAIVRRENQGSTYLGHRLLLPHGYVDAPVDVMVLFIRLEREMTIVVDNRRRVVKYIFAVITSKQKAQQYLKVLKAIATLVVNHSHVLENAKSVDEFIHAIDQKAPEIGDTLTARELISCDATVRSSDPVHKAVVRMENNGLTILPVVNANNELEGIVDLADLFTATFPERIVDPESLWLLYDMSSARDRLLDPVKRQWEKETNSAVRLVMKSGEPYTIAASAEYSDIVNHMAHHRRRFAIVVDEEKKVLGLIDSSDLVHRMIKA